MMYDKLRNLTTRQKITYLLLIVVGVVVFWFLWWLIFTATIKINAPEGSDIFIKQSDNSFEYIGKTTATYRTRSTDTVFIEARKSDQTTQKSTTPQRRKTTTVTLDLGKLSPITRVADGPITYPLATQDFLIGINPNTNGMTYKKISGRLVPEGQEPSFPILPYLKQIFWFDQFNFVYVTLGFGTGSVVNNQEPAKNDSYSFYSGAMLPTKSGVALLGDRGLHYTSGTNVKEAKKIYDLSNKDNYEIFSDSSYVYVTALSFEPIIEEDQQPIGKETKLLVFDSNGKKIQDFVVPIKQQVQGIATVGNNKLYAIAGDKVFSINMKDRSINESSFSFDVAKDIIAYKDEVFILSTKGLWRFDQSSQDFKKVANYPPSEEYVYGSLTVYDNSLFFSSKLNKYAAYGPDSRSSVFRLDYE